MKMKNLIIAGLTAAMMCTSFAAAEEATPADAAVPAEAAAAEAAAPAEAAPSDAAAPAGEAVPFESLKLLGTQEEGAWSVTLKNMTGKDIKSVMIKKMDEKEFTKELLAEGETFAKEEQRILYYKDSASAETEGETAETAEPAEGEAPENTEAEKLLTDGYDIQLTFAAEAGQEAAEAGQEAAAPAEGTAEQTAGTAAGEAAPQAADVKVVLHAFPYEDIVDAEILFGEEVAYLKYKSQMTQEEISTLEFEKNVKLREAAAAAEQAEGTEGADSTQAAATPAYEDNSANYTYSDSGSGSYNGDSYDASYDYSYDDSYDDSYDYSYDDSYDYSYDDSYDYSYDESYDDYSYDSSYDDYSYDYSYDDYSGGDDDACIEDGLFY